jgi:putative serine protease PepD
MRVAGIVTGVVVLAMVALTGQTLREHHRVEDDLDRVQRDLEALADRVDHGEEGLASVRALLAEAPLAFDSVRLFEGARPSVFQLEAGGSQGTAFVVASDEARSRLLTSYHVIAEAWRSYRRNVRLTGVEASAIGTIEAVDVEADLAVIDVEATWSSLEVAPSQPETGEEVLVLGSPMGLEGTITRGVVSGTREGFLQLSAAVSPGSSGSPVLDAEGRVLAVVSWKFTEQGAEGLSFAVPIKKACEKLLRC